MKFGVFYEHQLPRPWVEGSEQQLFQDALSQVELADRLGIDYAEAKKRNPGIIYCSVSGFGLTDPPELNGPDVPNIRARLKDWSRARCCR